MYHIYLFRCGLYRLEVGEQFTNQRTAMRRADDLRIINGLKYAADAKLVFWRQGYEAPSTL